MRAWLQETHSAGWELVRHFLLRFFDSELVSAPGHSTTAIIGAFSLLLPWFELFISMLRHKYAYFSSLAVPGPYRQAVKGDELWLLTLMMSAVGLLAAIKWQSLFPGLRDYQALGPLPLKPRQIFTAKLVALLVVATATVITLNAIPSIAFPAVSGGRWQINPSLGAHMWAHASASAAASYFFFFAMVAIQGVLLNLLRPRPFRQVSGYVQGCLVAVMLILMVLSFSIQPQTATAAARPEISRWLPPVWFLGLYQSMLGDPDPNMQMLSGRALAALGIAIAVSLITYLIGYHRHRELLVEGISRPARDRRWAGAILDWAIPNRRQQAVIVFMAKTLARSSHHRMILMAYGGFGVAILLSGMIGMRAAVGSVRLMPAYFVYAHVIFLIFLLIGLRHLFSIPAELKANWTFQITEREGRSDWLRAVDRFVLFAGGGVMLLVPFPVEVALLGWRAVGESVLFIAVALLCYEWVFSSWEKLPFTCSSLPGKTPMWVYALGLLGLLTALPVILAILIGSLYNRIGYVAVLVILLAVWTQIHTARKEGWGDLRLKYDEVPDPAIHGLNLRG